MANNHKYIFSGHESFPCKSLWLKKGYDFVREENDFNVPEAVVKLGVGKNMVASIRYWLKVFGVCDGNDRTALGDYLFDDHEGKDRYLEDLATLWLLHFTLVFSNEASLYNIVFTKLQRERKVFSRTQVVDFVHGIVHGNTFNQNTVKKDVNVLLQNYCLPRRGAQSNEDFSALLLDLDLIRYKEDTREYVFNIEGKRAVTPEVFFYGILMMKGTDNTIPYDVLQTLGLVFCMTDLETIDMLKLLSRKFADYVTYSDVAGIRQMQFTKEIDPFTVLDQYYAAV